MNDLVWLRSFVFEPVLKANAFLFSTKMKNLTEEISIHTRKTSRTIWINKFTFVRNVMRMFMFKQEWPRHADVVCLFMCWAGISSLTESLPGLVPQDLGGHRRFCLRGRGGLGPP